MSMQSPASERRAAKREQLERDFQAHKDELAEARNDLARATDELARCQGAIRRIDAELRYRTAPGKSVVEAKAEALARAAMGDVTLEEARSTESGDHSKMSISELTAAQAGLARAQIDAERAVRDGQSRVRRLGLRALEAAAALSALRYDDAVETLVDAWGELRSFALAIEGQNSNASPVSHVTWSQLRLPLHHCRAAMTTQPSSNPFDHTPFLEAAGIVASGATNAAHTRVQRQLPALGVQ